MIWNWSHTQKAYDNVYYNISQISLETLREIAAEIKTYQITKKVGRIEPTGYWNETLYNKVLTSNAFTKLNSEDLTNFIYKFAAEQAECTNGGYEVYVCPYGCHSVSLSKK